MSENEKNQTQSDGLIWGLILMAFGVIFLLDRLDIVSAGGVFSTFWPVILIAIGIRMILAGRPPKPKTTVTDSTSLVSDNEFLRLSKTVGDVGLKIDSKDFSGGRVSTVFGDVLVDLSEANIKSGEHELKLNGVFGDISVSLPKNVKVSVRANTMVGDLNVLDFKKSGFGISREYQSEGYDRARKKLVISASQVVGDVMVAEALE